MTTTHKIPAIDAVTFAHGIVDELYDETEQWRDNIEEKFSSTDKFSQLCDILGELEDAHNYPADLPKSVEQTLVEFTVFSRNPNRPTKNERAQWAADALTAVANMLAEEASKLPPGTERDEMTNIEAEISDHIDTIGSLDFPRAVG